MNTPNTPTQPEQCPHICSQCNLHTYVLDVCFTWGDLVFQGHPTSQPHQEQKESWEDDFNTLVRDLTKFGSVPKSEARQRLNAIVQSARREEHNQVLTSLITELDGMNKLGVEDDKLGQWGRDGYNQALSDVVQLIQKEVYEK